MTPDTKDLEATLDAWRELNVKRVEAMQSDEPDKVAEVVELDHDEVYRLRDIAGEAMQLVDQIKSAGPQKVYVAQLADDEIGWHSVHCTEKGARADLEKQAALWGIDLQAIDDGECPSYQWYGLSYMPVKE